MTPGTFSRSLSKRTWLDQGIITGLSVGATYLLTVVTQDGLQYLGSVVAPRLPLPQSVSDETRAGLGVLVADLAAVPVGLATMRLLPTKHDESLRRSMARQGAWRAGTTGVGAGILAVATAGSSAVDRRLGLGGRLARIPLAVPAGLATAAVVETLRQSGDADEPDPGPMGANPLLGVAAATGVVAVLGGLAVGEGKLARELSSLAASRLPGSPAFWQLAGHSAILGACAAGLRVLWAQGMERIEQGTTTFGEGLSGPDAQRFVTSEISGSTASLVAWDTMGREGRRHAFTYVRPAPVPTRRASGGRRPDLSITTVMGGRPRRRRSRSSSGSTVRRRRPNGSSSRSPRSTAPTPGRARCSCSSRPPAPATSTTCAIAAAQYLTRGDMASVTLQYSKRPSPLSLGKVPDAREQNRLLWLRILERVRLTCRPDKRPKVVLFGESLARRPARTPFQGWGTLGPEALGIDRALWIGTPARQRWRTEVLRTRAASTSTRRSSRWSTTTRSSATLATSDGQAVRYVLLSHDNDGVTKFGTSLLHVARPGSARTDHAPRRCPGTLAARHPVVDALAAGHDVLPAARST